MLVNKYLYFNWLLVFTYFVIHIWALEVSQSIMFRVLFDSRRRRSNHKFIWRYNKKKTGREKQEESGNKRWSKKKRTLFVILPKGIKYQGELYRNYLLHLEKRWRSSNTKVKCQSQYKEGERPSYHPSKISIKERTP